MESKIDTTYSHFYVGTYTRKEGHVDGVAEGVYCYKMNELFHFKLFFLPMYSSNL